MKYLFLIPLLTFAQPKLEKVVLEDQLRIIFSEPMDSSVVVKENYQLFMVSASSLTSGIVPHITEIGRVLGEKDTIFVFTTLLPSGLYRLEVNNVYDLGGNMIDPEHNSIAFSKDEFGLHLIKIDMKTE